MHRSSSSFAALLLFALLFSLPPKAAADIDPLSGIDFVTIGSVGNAPWAGDGTPDDQSIGRGGVNYEYRIGKFEVTTGQWVEFMNAAFDRPQADWIPHLQPGLFWAVSAVTPNTPGGRRWSVSPAGAMLPTGGVDWRTAAIYCNWLHNNKSLDRSAFFAGVYDISTFGYQTLPNGVLAFTDQAARSPNARYFIPTLDEWIKAAHYDPIKVNGDGTLGGYWTYSNTSNLPYVGALPPSMGGTGTANFGFDAGAFTVPLGAYTNVTSPWGLFDVAGGSTEWLETIITDPVAGANYRVWEGSGRSTGPAWSNQDAIYAFRAERPNGAGVRDGFRIAATIPAPSTLVVMAAGLFSTRRTRRRGPRVFGPGTAEP